MRKNFENFFLKITKNNVNYLKQFVILKKNKENKNLVYNKDVINLALNFLKSFNHYSEQIKKEYLELNFMQTC